MGERAIRTDPPRAVHATMRTHAMVLFLGLGCMAFPMAASSLQPPCGRVQQRPCMHACGGSCKLHAHQLHHQVLCVLLHALLLLLGLAQCPDRIVHVLLEGDAGVGQLLASQLFEGVAGVVTAL